MNIIQTIEAEHAAKLPGAKMPAFQPGDTVDRQREGRGRRAHPRPGLRGRVHRAQRPRPQRELHGAQDLLRRGRRARLSGLFADDRLRLRWCAAARSGAPSSITCATAAASRPASPSARTTRPPPRSRARNGADPGGKGKVMTTPNIAQKAPYAHDGRSGQDLLLVRLRPLGQPAVLRRLAQGRRHGAGRL